MHGGTDRADARDRGQTLRHIAALQESTRAPSLSREYRWIASAYSDNMTTSLQAFTGASRILP